MQCVATHMPLYITLKSIQITTSLQSNSGLIISPFVLQPHKKIQLSIMCIQIDENRDMCEMVKSVENICEGLKS